MVVVVLKDIMFDELTAAIECGTINCELFKQEKNIS